MDSMKPMPTVLSKRWILAFLCSLGLCISSNLRLDLSIAIVCMVADPSTNHSDYSDGSSSNQSIKNNNNNNMSMAVDRENFPYRRGEFNWDTSIQSTLLSAFFYGYSLAPIPVSYLAAKFGAKRTFGFGISISALATILIPAAARWDYRSVLALRVIIGCGAAAGYCCVNTLWGVWAPSDERTRLIAFSFLGDSMGDVTTFFISGFLCAYGFDNGWGSIFYLTGVASLMWTCLWFYLVSDTPGSHPTITQAERLYLCQTRGQAEHRKLCIPWRDILKSRALWACIIGHVSLSWVYFTFLTALPTFMNDVLQYDIKQNGLFSSLPYIVMAVFGMFSSHVADFCRAHGLTTTWTRRLFQTLSFALMGTCIVMAGYLDPDNRLGAVALLTLGIGAEGIGFAGVYANSVDYGQRYAGILNGMATCLGSATGMLAPVVNGILTPDGTQEQWRYVFIICGGVCFLGIVVFGGFAVGEPEPWALQGDEDILIKPDLKTDLGKQGKNGYVVEWGES